MEPVLRISNSWPWSHELGHSHLGAPHLDLIAVMVRPCYVKWFCYFLSFDSWSLVLGHGCRFHPPGVESNLRCGSFQDGPERQNAVQESWWVNACSIMNYVDMFIEIPHHRLPSSASKLAVRRAELSSLYPLAQSRTMGPFEGLPSAVSSWGFVLEFRLARPLRLP